MNYRRLLLLIALFILLTGGPVLAAQPDTGDTLAYGQTGAGQLAPGDEQAWSFEGRAGDMLEVALRRIGGRFTPLLSLAAPDGRRLIPQRRQTDEGLLLLTFSEGLPQDGPYQLLVSGQGLTGSADNPDEYSLTLHHIGGRVADRSADLGLPALFSLPALESEGPQTGEDERGPLNLEIYGTVTITRPQPGQRPGYFLAEAEAHTIADLFNGSSLARVLRSLSFTEDGIGATARGGAHFFTDSDIADLRNDTSTISATLSGGQLITTDFYHMEHVLAVEGRVEAKTVDGQRIVLHGRSIDMRAGPGGALVITVDGRRISLPTSGWETLALLPPGRLALLLDADLRLLSDATDLTVSARLLDGSFYYDILAGSDPALILTLDPYLLADVNINGSTLTVTTLDGRELAEPLRRVSTVYTEAGAVQFQRDGGTYRLSLPDATEIETPARFENSDAALPHEPGYRPRGLYNLGAPPQHLCPCGPELHDWDAVNPLTGSFYYSVQDLFVPSHTLPLEFTRHYNSQGPALTPDYLAASPGGYWPGRLGPGWRHNHQTELDLTYAPLGRITLIMPDGARHIFRASANNGARFASDTLREWTLLREAGLIGTWRAVRADGLSYHFDRAGRLARVTDKNGLSLLYSPAPHSALRDGETGGFYVTEPYGRRLEVYTGQGGRVLRLRSPEAFETFYNYNQGGELTGVLYSGDEQQAAYGYNNRLLTDVDDPRSPYAPQLHLRYDGRARVLAYTEDPAGLALQAEYSYQDFASTTRSSTVSGAERQHTWTFDARGLLLRRTPAAGADWAYSYEYDSGTLLLNGLRQPGGARFQFGFNERGYLLRITDPIYTTGAELRFSYSTADDGLLMRLDAITHAAGGYERFGYDAAGRLITHSRLIQPAAAGRPALEYVTRYEYNDWGRLLALYRPGPEPGSEVATTYSYDAFGYVSQVVEGDGLRSYSLMHDRAGRLRSLTDGRGHTYTLTWDEEHGRLIAINGPEGLSISYSYDLYGRPLSIIDRGQETQFVYDTLGRLLQVIDALDNVTAYSYDEAGSLLSLTPPGSQGSYQYSYDALDRLIRMETPSGLVTTYTTRLEATGNLVHTTAGPTGRSTSYTYDALLRLRSVEVSGRGGLIAHYILEYTPHGFLSEVSEQHLPERRALRLTYNLLGQPLTASIQTTTARYSYNSAGWLAAYSDPAGNSTAYSYDPLGRVTSVTLPAGPDGTAPVYSYSYDENNNLTHIVDPTGGLTVYAYDALNRLESVLDPTEGLTSYSYDADGSLTAVQGPNGESRSASYDALGRLAGVVNGMGERTGYSYDAQGRLVRITEERGRSTTITYDPDGRIIAITLPSNSQMLYSYDAAGRINSITDALGHTTSYIYDALNRVTSMVDPLGNATSYEWLSGGRRLNVTGPEGRLHEYSFNALGLLTGIRDATSEQNAALATRYRYDALGQVVDVRHGTSLALDGGTALTHAYSYTTQGLLATYTDPAGGLWRLEYDLSGRLAAATDPEGVRTAYSYDAAGRLVVVEYDAGGASPYRESYSYDLSGRLVSHTARDGLVTTFAYDDENRLIERVLGTNTDLPQIYRYGYDRLGYLDTVEDPLGIVTHYDYDLFGGLIRIRRGLIAPDGQTVDLAYSYEYDAAGNLTAVILPDGARTALLYNALDQRVRLVDAENSVWAYTYDSSGHLLQISSPLGAVTRYEYDTMQRVLNIFYPGGGVVGLRYDSAGWLSAISGAGTEVRSSGPAGELVTTASSTVSYTLDRLGRLVSAQGMNNGRTSFSYDALGRVLLHTRPDGARIQYCYDAHGRMVRLITPEGTSDRSYDAEGRLLSVVQTSSVLAEEGCEIIPFRGELYSFEYTPAGLLVGATTPDGLEIMLDYDEAGNLLRQHAGPYGTLEYTYDSLYRVIRVDAGDAWVELSYTASGLVENIRRSSGLNTSYRYDGSGRPLVVLHLGPEGPLDQFTYVYDAAGNVTRITRGDGWKVLFTYDTAGRVINERWLDADNRSRYALSIRYDDAGNRVETLASSDGGPPVRTLYVYDRENQLVQVISDYVPASPLALLPLLGFPLLVGGGLLRGRRRWLALALLLMIGVQGVLQQDAAGFSIRYEYDARGNPVQISYPETDGRVVSYRYDVFDRLTGVQVLDRDSGRVLVNTSLSYDPFNRLSEWETPEGRYALHYVGDLLVGLEELTTGARWRVLELEAGRRLLTIDPDGRQHWPLPDGRHNPRHVAGDDGLLQPGAYNLNVFGQWIMPYGAEAAALLPERPEPLFAGALYDSTSALYLMPPRAYDPHLGRYLQRDPLLLDAEATLYTYRPPAAAPAPGAPGWQPQMPQDTLPRPQMPQLPQPPAAADWLAAELERMLALGLSLRTAHPAMNPGLPALYSPAAMPSGPLPLPQAVHNPSPLALLAAVDGALLPAAALPPTPGRHNEAAALALLRETPPLLDVLPAPAVRLDAAASFLQAAGPRPSAGPPQPVVLPPVLDQVEALQAALAAYYEQALLPGGPQPGP